ncbi:MAG: hypothetical protein ACI9HK_003990 [Pirellulaceae bacterium]|jgi:hypothetical protein
MRNTHPIDKEIVRLRSNRNPLANGVLTGGQASKWGTDCTTIANSDHDFISNQKEIDEIFRKFRS